MPIEEAELNTFPKLLLHHSEQHGALPAIREKRRGIWHTTSWSGMAEEASALASALAGLELKRGEHVAFVGGNRPRLYVGICAAHMLGAVAVPLFQDASAGELASALQSVQATHAFAEDQEQVDKLLSILPACPSLRCIIYDQDRGMRHYRQPQLLNYAALLAQGRAAGCAAVLAEAAVGQSRDPAFVMFSAGTGGPAKSVVLSHATLINRARSAAQVDGLTSADVVLAYLPPAWIGQIQFAFAQPMVTGYCICCPESSETMLADMREIGPTYFLAPPRVFKRLSIQIPSRMEGAGRLKRALYAHCMALAQRSGARILGRQPVSAFSRLAYACANMLVCGPLRDVLGMSRLRVAYSAGEAIAPELLTLFRSIGVNLKQMYGCTENGFFVAMQRDAKVRPDTVGLPIGGIELKVGERNEILVRSAGLFADYRGDAQAGEVSRDADGWLRTGDAGFLDAEGQLHIVDRIRDIGTLANGSPYSPRQLESQLRFSPFVKNAVAFGEARETVCMMIDIDMEAVGMWADKHNISYTGHADLASRDDVYDLIGDCIAKANAQLAQDPALAACQIHRFLILPKELDADDGLLTRLGQVRRHAVASHYRLLVDALFGEHAGVELAGATGQQKGPTIPCEVKIRDATVFPGVQADQPVGSRSDELSGSTIRKAA